MGMAGSTHVREEECIKDIGGKARKKRPLGRSRVAGRILLNWVLER
jgi:hypothetical protein